jgi:hypothetical protein
VNEAVSALHAKDLEMNPILTGPILLNPWAGPWISIAIEFIVILVVGGIFLWKMKKPPGSR